MKKSSKIILTIVIILIIAAVVGGVLLLFSNLKKSNNKINELQNQIVDLKEGNKINNEENSNKSIESNNAKNEEQTSNSNNTENKNSSDIANEAIREALKERRFLAKNNIDPDSEAKFVKIADNSYLIHVEYEPDESGSKSTYFFVTYKNGQVTLKKQFVHKYVYDVSIDFDNLIIKAEIAYKGFVKDIFGKVNNGEYSQISDIEKPANEEYENTVKYTINENEVSKAEYETESNKYNKYNFVSFESKAVELNDANIDKYVK